jgi:hypothetical protein
VARCDPQARDVAVQAGEALGIVRSRAVGRSVLLDENYEAATAPTPARAPRRLVRRRLRERVEFGVASTNRFRDTARSRVGLGIGGSSILGVSAVLAGHRLSTGSRCAWSHSGPCQRPLGRSSGTANRVNRGVLCLASPTRTGRTPAVPGALAARTAPAARSFRKTPSAARILPGHVYFPSRRHALGKPT